MASRKGATVVALATAGVMFAFAAAGAGIGAGAADLPKTSIDLDALGGQVTVYNRRHSNTPARDGQTFDRGVWCAFKKEKVYDKYHDETYFVEKKVCLGTIVE